MKHAPSSDLCAALKGLLYPSETDAPIVPFRWRRQPGETAVQAAIAHSPDRSSVEILSLQSFFAPLQATPDGERFAALKSLLDEWLDEVIVVRTGSPKITIHIIGRDGGDWAGVLTESVET